jgi:hypothetical protein
MTNSEPLWLKRCPFCGNTAKRFPPDAEGNIVSCELGHAHMRTIEGWQTRSNDSGSDLIYLEDED